MKLMQNVPPGIDFGVHLADVTLGSTEVGLAHVTDEAGGHRLSALCQSFHGFMACCQGGHLVHTVGTFLALPEPGCHRVRIVLQQGDTTECGLSNTGTSVPR